ncbi:unnamed protein product, partial [Trichogramma brassicae]
MRRLGVQGLIFFQLGEPPILYDAIVDCRIPFFRAVCCVVTHCWHLLLNARAGESDVHKSSRTRHVKASIIVASTRECVHWPKNIVDLCKKNLKRPYSNASHSHNKTIRSGACPVRHGRTEVRSIMARKGRRKRWARKRTPVARARSGHLGSSAQCPASLNR